MEKKEKKSDVELVSMEKGVMNRMAKARPGFEVIAEMLAGVARKYPEHMGGIDLDQLDADLAAAKALVSLCQEANTKARMLEATRFVHNSQAWSTTLMLLDRARNAGRKIPEILTAIESANAFMKKKKKRKAKAASTTPTTSTAASAPAATPASTPATSSVPTSASAPSTS